MADALWENEKQLGNFAMGAPCQKGTQNYGQMKNPKYPGLEDCMSHLEKPQQVQGTSTSTLALK